MRICGWRGGLQPGVCVGPWPGGCRGFAGGLSAPDLFGISNLMFLAQTCTMDALVLPLARREGTKYT